MENSNGVLQNGSTFSDHSLCYIKTHKNHQSKKIHFYEISKKSLFLLLNSRKIVAFPGSSKYKTRLKWRGKSKVLLTSEETSHLNLAPDLPGQPNLSKKPKNQTQHPYGDESRSEIDFKET